MRSSRAISRRIRQDSMDDTTSDEDSTSIYGRILNTRTRRTNISQSPDYYANTRQENNISINTRDTSTPFDRVCRFYVLGKCRYGVRCTFSHTLPTSSLYATSYPSSIATNDTINEAHLTEAAAQVDCPFFLRGKCKYGDYCKLRHGTNVSQVNGERSDNALINTSEANSTSANAQSASASAQNETSNESQDFTCGICFDDIVESGKRFGLLSCDHCFCLDCLRAWRMSKDLEVEVIRGCPACRLPSNYIVPSLIFCTGEEKKKVVEAYKAHLALRECKYFNGRLGSCPFGSHCFYAHRDANGVDVKPMDNIKRPYPKHGSRGRGNAGQRLFSRPYPRAAQLFLDSENEDNVVGDSAISRLLNNYMFYFLRTVGLSDDEYGYSEED